MEFFEVYDDNGIYGFFEYEENAEKCAEYFEEANYGDLGEPDIIHVFIGVCTFDDANWME